MDEEELVDQADDNPSDDEEELGSEAELGVPPDEGDDDPDTGDDDPYAAQAREYDQSDDDNLTTGAVKTPGFIPDAEADKFFGGQQAPAAPKFIPDTEADKFFGQKTPGFIPDTEADKFFGDPKPGADDDNQFRGYIPTALRKFAQGLLKIDIPLEKGLAFLMYGDEKNWLTTSAEGREKNVNEFTDATPLRTTKAEDESITGRAAETVSQIAPLFLLGGGLGGMAAAGLQMGLSGVEAGHQRAKAAGADPSQQYQQGLAEGAIGVGVGAATMGAATLLKPFARSSTTMMNWAQTTLKEAAREGAVFGTAMEAQEYLGEQAAKTIYDPKAEYHFDMVRFLSGLAAGGAIGGTRGAFQRYNPTTPTTGDAPPPDMAAPEGTPGEQRQDAKGAPAVNNSAGEAHANVKPLKTAEVGDPQNVAASDKGNTGRWAKRQARREAGEEVPPESNTGVTVLDKGQVDPTFVEALAPLRRPEPATPEPTGEPPVAPQRSSDSVPPAEPTRPLPVVRSEDARPQYEPQPTPQHDTVIPHPEYLRAVDNPPLKEPPLPESPRPEITHQRASEGSKILPEAGKTEVKRELENFYDDTDLNIDRFTVHQDGRPILEVITDTSDPKVVHIINTRHVGDGVGRIPIGQMREIQRQILANFPRAETMTGRRVSGSRQAAPQETAVPVKTEAPKPAESPWPEITVPEAVIRPVTTARERETANLAEKPTVEPQARQEPAAAPPPEAPRRLTLADIRRRAQRPIVKDLAPERQGQAPAAPRAPEPAAAPPEVTAPRKPILDDLTAPPREFVPLQGQRKEAPALRGGKRPGAVFDPIATVRNEGEAALREKLLNLTPSQLKDMVADYGMDPGKFVSKRSPEKIIDHIAKLSSSRATKGDAFLDPNSSWSNRKEAPAPREEGAPEEYQLKPDQYPIKDASGRVIGGRKMETEARERTRVLATAGELMNGDRFPFDGTKFDPRKPADMKAYRDRAAAIVKAAKAEGWRDYFPKQKVEDSDYRQAPAEALFMKEMVMLAKERFNRESAAKTLERELDLRMGPEGVEAVRSQRRGDVRTVEYDDTKHGQPADEWSEHVDTIIDDHEKFLTTC